MPEEVAETAQGENLQILKIIITLSEPSDLTLENITKDWPEENWKNAVAQLSKTERLVHSAWIAIAQSVLTLACEKLGWNSFESQTVFLKAFSNNQEWIIDVFFKNIKTIDVNQLILGAYYNTLTHEIIEFVCTHGGTRYLFTILKLILSNTLKLDKLVNGYTPLMKAMLTDYVSEYHVIRFIERVPIPLLYLDFCTCTNETMYHVAINKGFWVVFQWLINHQIPGPQVNTRHPQWIANFTLADDFDNDEEFENDEDDYNSDEDSNEAKENEEKENLITNTIALSKASAINHLTQKIDFFKSKITNTTCHICCDEGSSKNGYALLWCCGYSLCWDCLVKLPKSIRSCPQCRQLLQPWMITRFH